MSPPAPRTLPGERHVAQEAARRHAASTPALREAIDALRSGLFSRGDRHLYEPLVRSLLDGDPFRVCADFAPYLDCQDRVSRAFANGVGWTRSAILNVARTGYFSSDRSIREYADRIWQVEPVEVSLEEPSADAQAVDPEDVEVVEQGRAIAQAVNGGVNGYLWFEANHPDIRFAGLIHLPWWDTDGPNVMKTYHSWKQWARLTPWDARCLGVTTRSLPASIEGLVAFQTPGASNLVVHVVKSGSAPDSLALRVAGHFLTRAEQFVTSASQAFAPVQDLSLPAGSPELAVSLQGNQLASFRLTLARFGRGSSRCRAPCPPCRPARARRWRGRAG